MENDDVNDDDDGHNEDDDDKGDVNEAFINICVTLRMQDLTFPLTSSWGLYKGNHWLSSWSASVCTRKALFVSSQNFQLSIFQFPGKGFCINQNKRSHSCGKKTLADLLQRFYCFSLLLFFCQHVYSSQFLTWVQSDFTAVIRRQHPDSWLTLKLSKFDSRMLVTNKPTPDVITTDWNLSKTGLTAIDASIQLKWKKQWSYESLGNIYPISGTVCSGIENVSKKKKAVTPYKNVLKVRQD